MWHKTFLLLNKNICTKEEEKHREREKDRQTETDRETDRQTETERENGQKQEADRQTNCTTEAVAIVAMTEKQSLTASACRGRFASMVTLVSQYTARLCRSTNLYIMSASSWLTNLGTCSANSYICCTACLHHHGSQTGVPANSHASTSWLHPHGANI